MEVDIILAISKLWPLALIAFLLIFVAIFHKQIRTILERRSIRLKKGDAELSIDGEDFPEAGTQKTDERRASIKSEEIDRDKSLQGVDEINGEDEKTIDELRFELISHFKEGEIEKGTEAFKKIQDTVTDEEDKLINQGEFNYLKFLSGDLKALDELKTLSEIDLVKAKIHNLIGKCHNSVSNYKLAAKSYELAAQSTENIKGRARYIVSQSKALIKTEAKSEPCDLLNEAIQKSENDDEKLILFLGLADLYAGIKDKENQALFLEKALEFQPNNTDLRFRVAYSYSKSDNPLMSIMHYVKLLDMDPNQSMALNNLGVAYDEFYIPVKSIESYKKSSDLGETLAKANLAFKYIAQGFIEEADTLLDEARKMDEVHENVGTAYAELKKRKRDQEDEAQELINLSEKVHLFFIYLADAMTLPIDNLSSTPLLFDNDEDVKFTLVITSNNVKISWQESDKKYKIEGKLNNHAIRGKKENMKISIIGKEISYKDSGKAWGYFSDDLQELFIMIIEEKRNVRIINLHKTE